MTVNPFAHPKVKVLFLTLLDSIFAESGRGALLIATAHVDDHLIELLQSIIPEELSEKDKKRFFSYPGPLSSFSARIELAYFFRLITKTTYDSLNALRRLRNNAAHSNSKFELHELYEQYQDIYDLGQGMTTFIRNVATEALVKHKFEAIKSILEEAGLQQEDGNKIIQDIFDDKEKMNSLEKQIPFWELTFGICLLCWLIIRQQDEIANIFREGKTLGALNKLLQKSNNGI